MRAFFKGAFFSKIRLMLNIILFFGCIFIVVFSLSKIMKTQKNFLPDKNYATYKIPDIHWNKFNYIVPNHNILLLDDKNLNVGEAYYIEQSLETPDGPEKCFLGYLKLQEVKKDRFVFFSNKVYNNSRLEKFSNYNSHKIMISPKTKSEFENESHLINCDSWIKLVNNNVKFIKKNSIIEKNTKNQKITLKNLKCMQISINKFIKIESHNSSVVYLEQDEIYQNIKLCSKQMGRSLVRFYTMDGAPPVLVEVTVILDKKKAISMSRTISKKNAFYYMRSKILPGWL